MIIFNSTEGQKGEKNHIYSEKYTDLMMKNNCQNNISSIFSSKKGLEIIQERINKLLKKMYSKLVEKLIINLHIFTAK